MGGWRGWGLLSWRGGGLPKPHHDALAAPSKLAPFVTADVIGWRVTRAGGRQRGGSSDRGSVGGQHPSPPAVVPGRWQRCPLPRGLGEGGHSREQTPRLPPLRLEQPDQPGSQLGF